MTVYIHLVELSIELVIHYRFMGSGSETIGEGSHQLNYLPMPDEFSLYQNYPNPFNPATTISYDLPNDDMVSITIYDMMGREVRTLVSASQTAGRKSIRWEGTNNAARQVAAGIYLCVIQTPQYFKTNKIIMLK